MPPTKLPFVTKPRRVLMVLGCVVLVYLLLTIATALTKRPIVDEGWFASPALNLATKGQMGTSVLEESGTLNTRLEGIKEHTYWVMPLDLVAQAGWYRLFPFSLFTMRALSIMWGLVALVAWFIIVHRLSGNINTAVLAFALIAVDYVFMTQASIGRMDMMCAALGFLALATYLALHERRLMWAVIASQSLIVLSGLTHPNGILPLFAVAFTAVFCDLRRLRLRHAAAASVPYVVGALAWGAYVLQSRSNFETQFAHNAGNRFPGLAHPLTAVSLEVTEKYMSLYGFAPHVGGPARLKILILVVYFGAVVTAVIVPAIRRRKGYQVLLVLTLISIVAETIFNHKIGFYLVHVVPFFAATVAVVAQWCWQQRPGYRWLCVSIIACLVLLETGAVLYRVEQRDYQREFQPASVYLQQHTAPSDLVLASAEMAFGAGFDRVVDDPRLEFYTGKHPDYIVVGDDYNELFGLLRSSEPAVYGHINSLLTGPCTKEWQGASYQIYHCHYQLH